MGCVEAVRELVGPKVGIALRKAGKLFPIWSVISSVSGLPCQYFRRASDTFRAMEVGGGVRFDLCLSGRVPRRNFWTSNYNGASLALAMDLVRPGMVTGVESMVVPCFHNQAPVAPSIQSPQEK
jgi:hypothetical protein